MHDVFKGYILYVIFNFCMFVQGLKQKAEALYTKGNFEFALVFYQRGFKLRPEVKEFRLGIQKAQEAIDNSIGGNVDGCNTNCSNTRNSAKSVQLISFMVVYAKTA